MNFGEFCVLHFDVNDTSFRLKSLICVERYRQFSSLMTCLLDNALVVNLNGFRFADVNSVNLEVVQGPGNLSRACIRSLGPFL